MMEGYIVKTGIETPKPQAKFLTCGGSKFCAFFLSHLMGEKSELA